MSSNSAGSVARKGRAGGAAALSLIDIRGADRAPTPSPKVGDLTKTLKQRGEAGAALPVQERNEGDSDATSKPAARRPAAVLPEPYVAPAAEIAPSYFVGAAAAVLPSASSPPATARPSPPPYDDLRSADELVYYWDELRGYRALPLLAELDRTRIAVSWPNTLLVNFAGDHSGLPEVTRLSRFTGAVEVTTLVTEWIFSSSRQVAKIGKAMETERRFTGQRNTRRYHMMLLPFAGAGGASDHVLCHLSCTD